MCWKDCERVNEMSLSIRIFMGWSQDETLKVLDEFLDGLGYLG